jgi:hypothetical protein
MALDKWGLDRRHLLLLFIAGMASRGMIKVRTTDFCLETKLSASAF